MMNISWSSDYDDSDEEEKKKKFRIEFLTERN
jgi:hypothetical protein